jgi:exodeoxyribonuclease VII large subunit
MRAATPSAAAELATPSAQEIASALNSFKMRALGAIDLFLNNCKSKLDAIKHTSAFLNPENIIKLPQIKFSSTKARFLSAVESSQYRKTAELSQMISRINALNPLNILQRGFAFVTQNENIVKDVSSLEINSEIDIRFANGTAKAVIKSKEG